MDSVKGVFIASDLGEAVYVSCAYLIGRANHVTRVCIMTSILSLTHTLK